MAQSKGHCWLENEGSTCYLNAVLQTLFMTKEFREQVKSDLSGDNFIEELKKLFIELDKQQKTKVSAAEVTKCLGIINVDEQADAAQLLHLIIRKTPGSCELFKGTLKTTRTCKKCIDEQKSLENLLSLIVSFKDSQDVEASVKAYVDQMCGEYKMTCLNCKSNTDWERKTEMIIFPKILIIQLERLEMDSSDISKSNRKVNIRPHIEVSFHKYDLYAIINHSGTYKRGHYNVDIKCEGQIWRRFDDDCVSKSPINGLFRNESFTLGSSEAHLLVYRLTE